MNISSIGMLNRAESEDNVSVPLHITSPFALTTTSTSVAEPMTRKDISFESSLISKSAIPNELSGMIMETPYGPAARRTARTAAPPIRRGSTPLSDIFCPT